MDYTDKFCTMGEKKESIKPYIIIESLRLEKTSKNIKSNPPLTTNITY